MKTIALFAATAIAVCVSATASAATNPTPNIVYPGQGFALERVADDFPRSTFGEAYLDFFSALNSGGLSISDADGPDLLVSLIGAQLYTNAEVAPVMRLGVFSLTDSNGVSGYSLSVTDAAFRNR